MRKYIVEGGRELYGSVTVSGSKNAALPVLFASLAVGGVSEITNLPNIGDVRVALEILRCFGVSVEHSGSTVRIFSEGAGYTDACRELASQIRASTYLLGACLCAFGKVSLMPFGGCNFSYRPIDIHLDACAAFGAEREGDLLYMKAPRATDFTVRKSSVGASVNSLILAASAEGESVLRGVAREPHIELLIKYLSSAGAKFRREGDILFVRGARLRGGRVRITPDMIEAGSYLIASAVAGGRVKVVGAPREELNSLLILLENCGMRVIAGDGYISLEGEPIREIEVTTAPYPGFPTDLQPIIAPLLGKGRGGRISETVWQGRFGYLDSLKKQGLKYELGENGALIYPSEYRPATVRASDLRGGAASVIAALAARGRSEIEGAEIIERGYFDLSGKLCRLGACVKVN